MQYSIKYDPSLIEDKWYSYWLKNGFFKSEVDKTKEAYTIVIPPPNVTGVLHMGHMLNNTIQDVLVRRARMQGKNACWVPGTDHASIATEAKVVKKLALQGIEKSNLSREEFLEHAWKWTEKHGGIILEQLKKLGASCDWDRTKFTMDKNMSESVIDVFIDLYKKGYVYRGIRMINWDTKAKTAVSDEEVIYKEIESKLYYVNYEIIDEDGKSTNEKITIATTRPETILGDTAVCVNPTDERFLHLKGKKAMIPLVNRIVPIIFDEYVEKEFGTGALKITPSHDLNDYKLGLKYKLENINILNDDGTLNENAEFFIGEDRFKARKLIIEKLKEKNFFLKEENYVNKVGFSERTDIVIEPKLSVQWFLKMKKLSEPALKNVMNESIKFHPKNYKNTYRHWLENIRDWNISRQLLWGHRIPAYYLPNGEFVIAKSKIEAYEIAKKDFNFKGKINHLKQDEDVLDTWFSSWLWPISVFDGIRNPNNEEIKYYYPTNDLVTAPEIIFFWVARMAMAGYEYLQEKPFKNVYFTGIVRDQQRRKMSKSLGNSPDPISLIKKYSADGVRVGMLFCSPAGGDLLFDENLTEQGRNFGNKIWNAFRLVKSWKIDENIEHPQHSNIAVLWFNEKLNQSISIIDKQFKEYRLSEALMTVYKLFWDEFSSWYLEIIKPDYQKCIDEITYFATIEFFEKLLKILHPFMPFITEEIWHTLKERKNGESIMISKMPELTSFDENFIEQFEIIKGVISNLRKIRTEKNIPHKDSLELFIKSKIYDNTFDDIILRVCNLSKIKKVNKKIDGISFIVKTSEFFIPIKDKINIEKEVEYLKKDIFHLKNFLKAVSKKLNNEKFVKNAPDKIVNLERKKQKDVETKIKILEEQILNFS